MLLLSSAVQNMCDQTFLEITGTKNVSMKGGDLVVLERAPKAPINSGADVGAKNIDNSKGTNGGPKSENEGPEP